MADEITAAPVVEAGASRVANPKNEKLETILRGWISASIHNSPVAQSTAAFNHLTTTALADLKRRLLSEF